jgi:hypothetical protein
VLLFFVHSNIFNVFFFFFFLRCWKDLELLREVAKKKIVSLLVLPKAQRCCKA